MPKRPRDLAPRARVATPTEQGVAGYIASLPPRQQRQAVFALDLLRACLDGDAYEAFERA